MAFKYKEKSVLAKERLGRPPVVVDEKLLFELAKIHCTKDEMANIIGCHRDTLYANFSDILQKGFDEGKRSLRRKQWELAEQGNIQMLIWLGKQWLGQKDKQPEEVASTTINVQVNQIP